METIKRRYRRFFSSTFGRVVVLTFKISVLSVTKKFHWKEDVHLGTFLKKLNSTFLNNMGSEIVSLGVWGSKEIIYHYDFIPSSTLFRSMKLCTKRRNQKIRHSEFFEHFSEKLGTQLRILVTCQP